MTDRVDFYVLRTAVEKMRRLVACRLAEKAYLNDLRVVLLAATDADARALDDLLWTFDERSFVPHQVHGAGTGAAPVQIAALGAAAQRLPPADFLVNLAAAAPGPLEHYGRIAEIVDADEDRRRLGRERFKTYRERKVALETHQLGDTADV
jgi:DNA polymerase-3 subunit chi